LCDTSTESLDSSDVEGDTAGGETEKSFGGSSESSSLDAARWSPDNNSGGQNDRQTNPSVPSVSEGITVFTLQEISAILRQYFTDKYWRNCLAAMCQITDDVGEMTP